MLSKISLVSFGYHAISRNTCRYFSKTKPLKKLNLSNKCVMLGSAAIIGISAYILQKNRIYCLTENKVNLIETDIEIEADKSNIDNRPDNKYEEAIRKSREVLHRVKDEFGAPGMVVGVSIDGKTVWTEGLGYSDIENRVLCSADTVMRIASISKSITMSAVAKLWEQGKLDLDKPIQEYVPSFPHKSYEGKPVVITCRHLVSHLGGIRHYGKGTTQDEDKNSKNNGKSKKEIKEFDHLEYYIKEKHDVKSSLNLFKDDPLIAKPGTKYFYTTHGWTLVSAIVEAVTKEDFPRHLNKLFKTLGMKNTYVEENDIIIYNRSRNYKKNKYGHLVNTPYVDNSYKLAGGGILSTVPDLLRFANAMLYSFQFKDTSLNEKHVQNCESKKDINSNTILLQKEKILPGFLNSKTVETMWTPVISCNENTKYAMGWAVFPEKEECQYCEKVQFCVYHTGAAIGASSILLIVPKSQSVNELSVSGKESLPKGVIVAIVTNLMSANLTHAAQKIAENFENL